MVDKTEEISKLYYSISEVSEMFDVKTSLIRFWEKEFDIIQPKKNKKGNRLFTKNDIENLRLIYHLVKETGFTLDGAKKHLKNNKKEIKEQFEIVNKLKKIRTDLLTMKENIK